MASHVAHGAGAEIEPTPPFEWMIDILLERTLGGRTEPEVPVETLRHRILALRAGDALWPDRTVGPDVDLLDRADDAALHHFDGPAQPILGTALVAHLCDHLVVLGQL